MHYSPLKFEPMFKSRIWGSDRLKALYNKDLPASDIGESWELADLPGACSVVSQGQFKGWSWRAVLEEYGLAMGFTQQQCQGPFGLFIKFLDANDVLSVQVHPDKEACKLLPGADLKTECWFVLEAGEGGCIYKGMQSGITREKFEKALEKGEIEQYLVKIPVKKGDFHHLPAGTIHALGAGVVIAEVQTPSDTTYRVFDWNRIDADGQGRQLHIEQALASIHFEPVAENADFDRTYAQALRATGGQLGTARSLVDCEFFSVVHIKADRSGQFECDWPLVAIILAGSGQLMNTDDKANKICYNGGDTLLLPRMQGAIQVQEATELLLCCLGPAKAGD